MRTSSSRFHSGPAWDRLEAAGANPQRLLWALTGSKSPAYSPSLYIDELIGENTITTVPDATLDAFRDAPEPAPDRLTVLEGLDRARADLAAPAEAGVDLDEITADLERAGVQQFADAYAQMLEAVTRKRQRISVS
jgi:transaldolase